MKKGSAALTMAYLALSTAHASSMFEQSEVDAVVRYWNEPRRYEVGLPNDWVRRGLWQVRLTVAGSEWFHALARASGTGKPVPGAQITLKPGEAAIWKPWIDQKFAYDTWIAQSNANQLNAQLNPAFSAGMLKEVEHPGPAPEALVKAIGNPPIFAEAVVPMRFVVRFSSTDEIEYQNNSTVPARYAYYRFPDGVKAVGKAVRNLPQADLDRILSRAGLGQTERNVMAAVSMLEGGFESVNTYDTGFVSIGFIQFASLREGGGSLGKLLGIHKNDFRNDFDAHFRRFGIDVTPDNKLAVVDPATGSIQVGAEANKVIIKDKRLIAVFQRAGDKSEDFRLSQIRTAHSEYYPASEKVTLSFGGKTLNCSVGDFIKTEAGLATLMDRKVNTGTLNPLPLVLANISSQLPDLTIEELCKKERQIVQAMKYRKDYLTFPDLTQPIP